MGIQNPAVVITGNAYPTENYTGFQKKEYTIYGVE
jgi:hypothetical protein